MPCSSSCLCPNRRNPVFARVFSSRAHRERDDAGSQRAVGRQQRGGHGISVESSNADRRTSDLDGSNTIHVPGQAGSTESNGGGVGMPPSSPLTHNALAMWTDSLQGNVGRDGGGFEMASHERVVMNGYLQHAVDLARKGRAPSAEHGAEGAEGGEAAPPSDACSSSGGSSSVHDSAASQDSDSVWDDETQSQTSASQRGWQKKVKSAVGRVVKEVSVVIGAPMHDRAQPHLSRSTLHGKNAGVGVQLVQGVGGCVAIGEVAPWAWAGKHGVAAPLSVGDVLTHIDDKKMPKGLSAAEAQDLLHGEQGTWVSLQLAGPSQGQVDMVMMDINGGDAASKEKRFLAGHRHRYTVQLMRLHAPVVPSSVRSTPPALVPSHPASQPSPGSPVGQRELSALQGRASRHVAPATVSPQDVAVAGAHQQGVRMPRQNREATGWSRGQEGGQGGGGGSGSGRERGMEALKQRARARDLLDETSSQMGVRGRRRRERTGLMSGLKMKAGLLRKMGALCSTAGACGAVDDGGEVRVRDWVWDEEDEEELLRDEKSESKGHPRQGAVARFLKRATKDGSKGGGDGDTGGVQREMSVKAVRSRGSVFRQESDGIGEMSFAGFATGGAVEEEVSDVSDPEDSEEEEELARAVADFPAERPHEIDLRVGQVVVVLMRHESGWWEGCLASGEGRTGWFPSNHVEILPRAPRSRKKKDAAAAAAVAIAKPAVGMPAGEDPAAFMPGLDYREASWADDAHHTRLDAANIDYKQASWAAFPRTLAADDVPFLGGVDAYAGELAEESDATFDEEEGGGGCIESEGRDAGADAAGAGWLQNDLFMQTSSESLALGSTLPSGRANLRSSGRECGGLTAVEEGLAHDGVWRYTSTHRVPCAACRIACPHVLRPYSTKHQ